jgi:hypothetical protein
MVVGKSDNPLRNFLPGFNFARFISQQPVALRSPLPVGHLEDIRRAIAILIGRQQIDDLYRAEHDGWGELFTG